MNNIGLFTSFYKHLSEWSKTGVEPKEADQDTQYYLDLQEKRLKAKGITIEREYVPFQDTEPQALKRKMHSESGFGRSINFRPLEEELVFRKDQKTIYKQKRNIIMYASIMYPRTGEENIGDTARVCPNCGAATKIADLIGEGCPYCRTKYIIDDLFPKVTNYFTINHFDQPHKIQKKTKSFALTGALIFAIPTFLIGLITMHTSTVGEIILAVIMSAMYAVITGFLGAFFGYCAYSISLLFGLFKNVGEAFSRVGALSSNKKLDDNLLQYDPSFSAEYFTDRVSTLFHIIAFSDEPEKYAQYNGAPLKQKYRDLVLSENRGGINVRSIRRVNNQIVADVGLYVTNYYLSGNHIERRNECVWMTMKHDTDFHVDANFSALAVKCEHCGGSFRADYDKHCKWCHQECDFAKRDWIIESIN